MLDVYRRHLKENAFVFAAVAVVLLLTQGRLLLYGGFGIDTDVMLFNPEFEYSAWNSIGRYALVWLSRAMNFGGAFSVLRAGIVTLIMMMLSVICWSALFSEIRGKSARLAVLLFSLLYVTSPLWTEQFYFKLQAQEVALTLALSALSVRFALCFAMGGSALQGILAMLLLTFTTGVYQSFVPFFLTGLCAATVLALFEGKEILWKRFLLRCALVILPAMGIHFLLSDICGGSSYHAAATVFWLSRPFAENIEDILRCYYYVYAARTIDFTPAIPLAAVAASVFVFRRAGKMKQGRAALIVLWLALLFGAPFSLHIVLGGSLPARARYAVTLLFAFLAFLTVCCLQDGAENEKETGAFWKQPALLVCAVLFAFGIIHSAWATLVLCNTDRQRFEEDVTLAEEIWAETAALRKEVPEAAIVYYGRHQATTGDRFEVIGHSLFSWGYEEGMEWYAADWIRYFFQSLGRKYESAGEARISELAPDASAMPVFPEAGSIIRRENLIFVKLSEKK